MIGSRLTVGFALVLGFTGCGTDEATAIPMPDVTGRQLDLALSDIERAGIDEEVEVIGGGTFGVVDESNWQVCEQLPRVGEDVTVAPRLTVDRSCGDDAPASTSPATHTQTTTAPTDAQSATSDQPSEEPVQEPEVAESGEPEAEQVLTVENSEEFVALLGGPGCGDDSIAAFADQYQDVTIEFDGHISALANHGDYDTRYDILLNTGDFSETTLAGAQNGPSFKFEDVNVSDLNLTGPNVPDLISVGDNVIVAGSVEDWNPDNCLFFLDPVSMEVR